MPFFGLNVMNLKNLVSKGDTEGFVNYGLSIMEAQVSAFFMEDLYRDFIKISFRSKEDVDVNQFARKYFNGGGHINATSGKYFKSIEDTIEDFKEKLKARICNFEVRKSDRKYF